VWVGVHVPAWTALCVLQRFTLPEPAVGKVVVAASALVFFLQQVYLSHAALSDAHRLAYLAIASLGFIGLAPWSELGTPAEPAYMVCAMASGEVMGYLIHRRARYRHLARVQLPAVPPSAALHPWSLAFADAAVEARYTASKFTSTYVPLVLFLSVCVACCVMIPCLDFSLWIPCMHLTALWSTLLVARIWVHRLADQQRARLLFGRVWAGANMSFWLVQPLLPPPQELGSATNHAAAAVFLFLIPIYLRHAALFDVHRLAHMFSAACCSFALPAFTELGQPAEAAWSLIAIACGEVVSFAFESHMRKSHLYAIDRDKKGMHAEAKISPGDVTLSVMIGQGGMGEVWHGRWSAMPVAVKLVRGPCRARSIQRFEDEVQMLASLRHPCICTFYGSMVINSRQALVMEYAEGGSLASLLRRGWRWSNPPHICQLALDVAAGLAFLHKKCIIHRDVKAANVLLDRMLHRAKVADVGLAKLCGQDSNGVHGREGEVEDNLSSSSGSDSTSTHLTSYHTAEAGTPRYAAPEVFNNWKIVDREQGVASSSTKAPMIRLSQVEYNERCDVYSFGLLLWEMCHCQIVFQGEDSAIVVSKVAAGIRPKISLAADGGVMAELGMLINECWRHDPATRISMKACAERLVMLLRQAEESAAATSAIPQSSWDAETDWALGTEMQKPELHSEEDYHSTKIGGAWSTCVGSH